MRAHGTSAYPEECCGILLGKLRNPAAPPDLADAEITEAIPAQNLAPSNRASRFVLDPRAYIHADRLARDLGLTVIGCYHSHPDHGAIPSATDVSLAWPEMLYAIMTVERAGAGEIRVWRYQRGEAQEVVFV